MLFSLFRRLGRRSKAWWLLYVWLLIVVLALLDRDIGAAEGGVIVLIVAAVGVIGFRWAWARRPALRANQPAFGYASGARGAKGARSRLDSVCLSGEPPSPASARERRKRCSIRRWPSGSRRSSAWAPGRTKRTSRGVHPFRRRSRCASVH